MDLQCSRCTKVCVLGVVKCPVWVSMSEVQGTRTRHVIAIVCAAAVLIRLTEGFWPAEDTQWNAELVNTSSLCFNASVEDVNPEDPAIWQYSRAVTAQPRSFLQNVHSLLGGPRTAAGCHRCDS